MPLTLNNRNRWIFNEIPWTDEWTEKFYKQATFRQLNVKFMIRFPLNRFQSLQRRFARDKDFKEAYLKVFNEYKRLNQVKLIHQTKENISFYFTFFLLTTGPVIF